MAQPEEHARQTIDQLLGAAGWHVCDPQDANISAHRRMAIREFPLKSGHGFADYMRESCELEVAICDLK